MSLNCQFIAKNCSKLSMYVDKILRKIIMGNILVIYQNLKEKLF